jgi:hypothetical protein
MTYRHENTDTSELVAHLKELTTALTAVHGDLYWLAMQTPKAQEDPAAPAADLNFGMLTELKNAVDDMRQLLHQYIATAAEVDPQQRQDGMDAERLHRVTKFLQLLRGRMVNSHDEQPVSFIERINAAVNARLGDKAA